MDAFDTHPLSCRFSAGRIPSHSALNDVVRRGLFAAGIPSMLVPSDLDRGDGKRPDGIMVYLLMWPMSHPGRYVRQHVCFFKPSPTPLCPSPTPLGPSPTPLGPSPTPLGPSPTLLGPSPTPLGPSPTPTLNLPASRYRDVRRHGEIDDPNFERFGSPTGCAISGSTRKRFPVPESVLGCSQKERHQHYAVVP